MCTGEPNINPSAVFAFSTNSLTISFIKHSPVLRQVAHPIHPHIGLFPNWNISVSILFSFKVLATSSNAVKVHPYLCGLPLTNNTFRTIPPYLSSKYI